MLAQTFIDAKNAGASDMTTLMALRFAAAKMGHGSSGFWDGKNLFNKANVYGMTQKYIDSKGYTGSTKSPKMVLFTLKVMQVNLVKQYPYIMELKMEKTCGHLKLS